MIILRYFNGVWVRMGSIVPGVDNASLLRIHILLERLDNLHFQR